MLAMCPPCSLMNRLYKLSADLYYNLIVVKNPECHCGAVEDAKHFLLNCPIYALQRNVLFHEIPGVMPINLSNLLYVMEILMKDVTKESSLLSTNIL